MANSPLSGNRVTNIDRRLCRRVVPLKVIVLGMARTGTDCMYNAQTDQQDLKTTC